MPVEARFICFSRREVEELLRVGAARANRSLPSGRLSCFGADARDFCFCFDRIQLFRLSPAELFSFILWYCQVKRLPVARTMKKRVDVAANHLILVLGDIEHAATSDAVLPELLADHRCSICAGNDERCHLETGRGLAEAGAAR